MNTNVTVIGTILMDCKGFSSDVYRHNGRNLGAVRFVHGGVGRNVAENLARLGVRVSMMSTVNADGNGRAVVEHLRDCGVRTEHIKPIPEKGMGFWLAILDENGNLVGSISDMPELGALERMVEEKGEQILSESSHVVLVLDLNEQLTKRILRQAQKLNKNVYGLPSNFSVIDSHPEVLEGLECFICNEFEAARLFGIPSLAELSREAQTQMLLQFMTSRSIKQMVVTLGASGAIYHDARTGESGFQPVQPVKLVDTSGAGDAFFSGTVMALANGKDLGTAVAAGTRIAGWTIESSESCCRSLGAQAEQDAFIRTMLGKIEDAL